mgnify:FL=1
MRSGFFIELAAANSTGSNANSTSQSAGGAAGPHRSANGVPGGGGGTDPNSKVPGNGTGGQVGGTGKGAKGEGDKQSGRAGGGSIVDGGYIGLPNPPYPPMSQDEGEEGTVKLEVIVEANGSVSSARVTKSSGHKRLDNAALNAAKKARYAPKQVDGSPVRTKFKTSFDFRIS